jgi:hypothetical protein
MTFNQLSKEKINKKTKVMNLTAEQIQENWDELMNYINEYISEPRKEKLLEFYSMYAERLMLMPAAHKKEYHNAFPGGYVEHVLRVIRCALKQATLWEDEGCDMSTFTTEELVFSALNHDLGKMGSEEEESYIPQTDNWRREKLGEDYMFNHIFKSLSHLYLIEVYFSFNHMVSSIHLMKWLLSRLMMVCMMRLIKNTF